MHGTMNIKLTETMYFFYRRFQVITIAGTASLGETISYITQHATDGYCRNLLPYRMICSSKNTSNSATTMGGQPPDDWDATCSTHGTRRAEIILTTGVLIRP